MKDIFTLKHENNPTYCQKHTRGQLHYYCAEIERIVVKLLGILSYHYYSAKRKTILIAVKLRAVSSSTSIARKLIVFVVI